MSSDIFWSALLGIVVQFALIYGAIRLALMHDRAMQARDANAKTSAEQIPRRAEEMRVYTETIEKRDLKQAQQATRASRERAEARRVAEQAARASRNNPDAPTE